MTFLLRDVRFGLRVMAKRPGLTILAALALALGLGAVTAQFSIINGTLFRGLPFEDSERLVAIKRWNIDRQPWDTNIPIHDFNDIVARQQSFDGVAGFFGGTINLVIDGTPVRLQGPRISHNFLDLIGERPILGRSFLPEEDQPNAPGAVILSYAVWQKHFNGDPDVIGRGVRVNGKPATIVGVMGQGFMFPIREEVWIPLQPAYDWSDLRRGDGMQLNVLGRLKTGVTKEAATTEIQTIIEQLAQAYPKSNERYRDAEVVSFISEFIPDEVQKMLYVMLASGVIVLLIACANVANLLLVSFSTRIKELAIRSSLGASRARLVSQILTEAVVLAAFGAAGGVALAVVGLRILTNSAQLLQLPFWITFDLDPTVLLVAGVTTVFTGLVSGLVPALRASRANMNDVLKDDTRTGTSLHLGWLSRFLVMSQIALACVLLVLSGLMVRSIRNIETTDYGFDTTAVMTARMGLFEGDYPTDEDRYTFWTRVERALENRPDLAHVALYGRYRWSTMGGWARLAREGRAYAKFEDHMLANFEPVTPGYFQTLGVKILAGRDFSQADVGQDARIIINQKLADELYPGEDPIGQRVQRQAWPTEFDEEGNKPVLPWMTIVGVVPAMQSEGAGEVIEQVSGRAYYTLLDPENTPMFMTVAARGRGGSPKNVLPAIREEIARLDPNLPLYAIGTPAEIIHEDTAQTRLLANIFKVFGVIAVFLAAVGIYGVVSFSVNQRRQEFGIRGALGATAHNLQLMILRASAIQLAIGLLLGIPAAWALSRLMAGILYGVSGGDLGTYAIVVTMLTVVAIGSCILPARRAARVQPAQALRYN